MWRRCCCTSWPDIFKIHTCDFFAEIIEFEPIFKETIQISKNKDQKRKSTCEIEGALKKRKKKRQTSFSFHSFNFFPVKPDVIVEYLKRIFKLLCKRHTFRSVHATKRIGMFQLKSLFIKSLHRKLTSMKQNHWKEVSEKKYWNTLICTRKFNIQGRQLFWFLNLLRKKRGCKRNFSLCK